MILGQFDRSLRLRQLAIEATFWRVGRLRSDFFFNLLQLGNFRWQGSQLISFEKEES
jgi:hypothetical protein